MMTSHLHLVTVYDTDQKQTLRYVHKGKSKAQVKALRQNILTRSTINEGHIVDCATREDLIDDLRSIKGNRLKVYVLVYDEENCGIHVDVFLDEAKLLRHMEILMRGWISDAYDLFKQHPNSNPNHMTAEQMLAESAKALEVMLNKGKIRKAWNSKHKSVVCGENDSYWLETRTRSF